MPYLEPEQVLREFSRYTIEEVRPALADDEEFMRGQVGSMASTLRFLAGELEGMDAAVDGQRESLLDALDRAESAVEDDAVLETLRDARSRVEAADDDARDAERVLLAAAEDALSAVDDLDEEAAREARRPLYDFLDTRLEAQLGLLGRRPDDG
jgi:hypothetical protein